MVVVAVVTTFEGRMREARLPLASISEQSGIDRSLLLVGNERVATVVEKTVAGLGFEIHLVEDVGPHKKHLAGLFCAAEDVAVTFDDDMIYAPDHAQALVAALGESGLPSGMKGIVASRPIRGCHGGPCDFIHGETGWAYRVGWLPVQEVLAFGRRPECRHNDGPTTGWIFAQGGRRCYVPPSARREHRSPIRTELDRGPGSVKTASAAPLRLRSALDATFWSKPAANSGPVRPGA